MASQPLHGAADFFYNLPIIILLRCSMETVSGIISIVGGLAAIFTFVTGAKSLAEWRRGQQQHSPSPETPTAKHGKKRGIPLRFYALSALFAVLIVITATAGLAGDDSSGLIAILLVLSALSIAIFEFWIPSTISRNVFGIATMVALAALGFTFGSISAGEEMIGLQAGVLIGLGTWIILVLTKAPATALSASGHGSDLTPAPQPPVAPEAKNSSPDTERKVLTVAKQHHGLVAVADVSLGSDLSLDQAGKALARLERDGHCQRETSPSGGTLYRFPDFIRE